MPFTQDPIMILAIMVTDRGSEPGSAAINDSQSGARDDPDDGFIDHVSTSTHTFRVSDDFFNAAKEKIIANFTTRKAAMRSSRTWLRRMNRADRSQGLSR